MKTDVHLHLVLECIQVEMDALDHTNHSAAPSTGVFLIHVSCLSLSARTHKILSPVYLSTFALQGDREREVFLLLNTSGLSFLLTKQVGLALLSSS